MIAFIGCVKTKKPVASKAIDLYDSALFRKSVEFARAQGATEIYILSAKHGLIHSDTVIEPYEETLVGKSNRHLKRWAYKVIKQADTAGIKREEEILMLAGENYAKYLRMIYKNVNEPLKGLGLGMRLAFLNRRK